VLRKGRRSDVSGRVIAPARGATLDLSYFDEEGAKQGVQMNLTDDEVAKLTGQRLTYRRVALALLLAVGAASIAGVLSALVNSGEVTDHPVKSLIVVTGLTVLVGTLFWKALQQVSSRALVLASGLGVLFTTLFAVVPNLRPETAESVKLGKIAIEKQVRLADYFRRPQIRELMGCRQSGTCHVGPFVEGYCAAMTGKGSVSSCGTKGLRGVVIYVPVESIGFRGKTLPVRWRLFDAKTATAVTPQPLDPFSGFDVIPEKRDSDELTLSFWVDTSMTPKKKLYVSVYVFDPRNQILATATSPKFTAG
jgi:hypothetical protein